MNESRWPRSNETEICLLTYDGAQHLKLHGWLKRHKVPIRAENIVNEEDCFGVFTVIINDDSFYELEEENTEKALFMDLQIIDSKKKDKPDIFFNPNNFITLSVGLKLLVFIFCIDNV